MTNFQIKSLQQEEFASLFVMDDAALNQRRAVKMRADKTPGFPCRVSLQDAAIGEEVILLPYTHHKTGSPYFSTGPVFIRKNAQTVHPGINEIPFMLLHRLLSLRGYDGCGMMKASIVTEGKNLAEALHNMFQTTGIRYIHIHNAKAGCYNCVAERV